MDSMIECLTLSPILQGLLAEITETQIVREGTRLPESEKGSKHVGAFGSDIGKRLYCAAKVAAARAVELRAKAEVAPDDNAERSLKLDADQTKMISDIMTKLAWYEVNAALSTWGQNLSMTQGWNVYEQKENDGPPPFIKRLLGMGDE